MSPAPEAYDDERGGRDDYEDSRPSTRRRRSRSRTRSRSPPRHRSSRDDRSRSPPRRERSRSPRRERSRSRSPRRMDDGSSARDSRSRGGDGKPYDPARKAMGREFAATEAAKRSKKENRVYVGNLSFAVKWSDLKDFMREAGTVVFAEIMMLPNGMSKGCGVVEYSTPEEAQKAIRELNDQTLLGRPLFIREDREDDARYGSAAVSGRAGYTGPGAFMGAPRGGFGGGRGGFGGGFGGGYGGAGGFGGAQGGSGRHLFIQGLPFNVGWQDLKDLFRAAGQIIRADTKMNPDGTPTGTGTVVYETAQDAQNAIAMYNGFEFQGNILEVREDRFAAGGGRGGFGGGFRGGRGGFGGGYGGGYGGAMDGYGDPSQFGFQGGFAGRGGFGGGFGGRGGFAGSYAGSIPGAGIIVPPSTQIFVKNLPWSTSNEDLIELFQTTGTVEQAEVLFDGGRSKGAGVVQFGSIEEAETAIAKFQGYNYGGRPLSLEYNGRFKDTWSATPAAGGEEASTMDE